MLEVEFKFAVADGAAVERGLNDLQARPELPREDVDRYFNAPDRDFEKTDEALRIRSIGLTNLVTYKGAKRDLQSKTRTELEVALADGADVPDAFGRLLEHLGYRPVADVRKKRRLFHLTWEGFAVDATLDEVDQVGHFAELEIQAAEDDWEPARNALLRLAEKLGLTEQERRSYLELLLTKRS